MCSIRTRIAGMSSRIARTIATGAPMIASTGAIRTMACTVEAYAPAYYYAPAFYGWAYNPWPAPIAYSWGFAAVPWYGYYGGYFTPWPVLPPARRSG